METCVPWKKPESIHRNPAEMSNSLRRLGLLCVRNEGSGNSVVIPDLPILVCMFKKNQLYVEEMVVRVKYSFEKRTALSIMGIQKLFIRMFRRPRLFAFLNQSVWSECLVHGI